MTPSSHRRRPAPAGALLKSIVAAAMSAIVLTAATSAQARLVITSAARSVQADTSASAPEFESATTIEDGFDRSVTSLAFFDSGGNALAAAAQNTFIGTQGFSGTGQATLRLNNGTVGTAASIFTLFFTLTSSASFTGAAELTSDGNAFSLTTFDLEELGAGGGSIVSGSDAAAVLPFAGTLGAGDYSLNVLATLASIDPNDSGNASFIFNLEFTDVADPPAGVPEPQTLALALVGLVACGAVRRRQPSVV